MTLPAIDSLSKDELILLQYRLATTIRNRRLEAVFKAADQKAVPMNVKFQVAQLQRAVSKNDLHLIDDCLDRCEIVLGIDLE